MQYRGIREDFSNRVKLVCARCGVVKYYRHSRIPHIIKPYLCARCKHRRSDYPSEKQSERD